MIGKTCGGDWPEDRSGEVEALRRGIERLISALKPTAEAPRSPYWKGRHDALREVRTRLEKILSDADTWNEPSVPSREEEEAAFESACDFLEGKL